MNVHKSISGNQTWQWEILFKWRAYLWETKYQWGNGDAFPLPYLIEIIQLGPALEPQRCHLGHFSGHDVKQKKCPEDRGGTLTFECFWAFMDCRF